MIWTTRFGAAGFQFFVEKIGSDPLNLFVNTKVAFQGRCFTTTLTAKKNDRALMPRRNDIGIASSFFCSRSAGLGFGAGRTSEIETCRIFTEVNLYICNSIPECVLLLSILLCPKQIPPSLMLRGIIYTVIRLSTPLYTG
jgi:hypothetical protein